MAVEEEYDQIYTYLRFQQYPEGFSKDQKRNFRRRCRNNFELDRGLLYFHTKGSKDLKQVPRSQAERERVLESCHSLTEGNVTMYIARIDKCVMSSYKNFYLVDVIWASSLII